VTELGLLVRWVHLASGVILLGTFAVLTLAPRTAKPTAERWEWEAVSLARACVLVALATGLGALVLETARFEGRPGVALDPQALGRTLGATRFGTVWIVRHGLLLLLAAFVFLAAPGRTRGDRLALHLQGALLAGAALGAGAGAGHAAAVEPASFPAVSADALHTLAVGVWIGGLAPLARLLRVASRPEGADARPFAVLTARRFSTVALGAVGVIVATGIWNARVEVGDVAGLVGTRYGHLLLLKLGLLAPILGLAAWNRRRLVPALGGDAETVGRPAMRRLGATVGVETLLGLAILAIAAVMTATPPGRHVPTTWPFPFRVSWGSSLPKVVDAYPTTYRHSPVSYQTLSIAAGARLFARECEVCHAPRAGDLVGGQVAGHTDGDLFWWVSHGIPGSRMPGFDDRLSEESRWDLVNYLRARRAANTLRRLGSEIEPSGGRVAAPDFSFAIGPGVVQSLHDYRGRHIVLLVLFSLPESRPRLDQIAGAYESLVVMGTEVIAVPVSPAHDVLRRLGATPPLFFPVATDGAREIVSTYELFRPAATESPHLEFLIDRRGLIRARIVPDLAALPRLGALLGEIQRLNAEPQPAGEPEEHLH